MKKRIITGFIAAILLVLAIYLATPSMILTIVLLCSVVACLEYDRLFFKTRSISRQLRLCFFIVFAILAIRYEWAVLWAFFWIAFVFHCVWHVMRANTSTDFKETLWAFFVEFFGYFYIVGLFGFVVPIFMMEPWGRDYLLLMFMVVSFGDTSAFFIGSRFGKRVLASRISPNKTIEGAVAAVVVSGIVSMVWLFFIYRGEVNSELIVKILGFALVGSVLAQLGDLFESILKRSQSIKDSGVFLPGHGGILDRTDGLAFVVPLFYFYLKYILEGLA